MRKNQESKVEDKQILNFYNSTVPKISQWVKCHRDMEIHKCWFKIFFDAWKNKSEFRVSECVHTLWKKTMIALYTVKKRDIS